MLVVLASLLIPISVISVWAIRTVTNTDQYVDDHGAAGAQPGHRRPPGAKATDALFSTHIVQNKVTAALPPKAKPIVTPIVNQVHGYVDGLALKFFESPKFGKLWDTLNRHTHDAVINVLTGKQTPLTKKLEKGGGIVVNLTPALNNIIDKANAKGITLFNPVKAILTQGDKLGVTVVSKSQVSKFTGIFNLIVKLKWVIPVVALLLAAAGIAIAVKRRKTLLRMAIGVALVTLLLLAGTLPGADHLHQPGRALLRHGRWRRRCGTPCCASSRRTCAGCCSSRSWWPSAPGWPARPATPCGSARRSPRGPLGGCAGTGVDVGRRPAAAGSERARRTGGWITEHLNGLRIVGVAVAALFLVFGGNLTGWSLLIIVIVLAVYLGLLQLVAAWARKVANPVAGSGTA